MTTRRSFITPLVRHLLVREINQRCRKRRLAWEQARLWVSQRVSVGHSGVMTMAAPKICRMEWVRALQMKGPSYEMFP